MKPINTILIENEDFSKGIREALTVCPSLDYVEVARIETYPMTEVVSLVKGVWKWPVTIQEMRLKGKGYIPEIDRVEKIMSLIKSGEEVWPYISYWADDMDQLKEVMVEDTNEISVMNHGDGWHRIIANIELNNLTMDFLFVNS